MHSIAVGFCVLMSSLLCAETTSPFVIPTKQKQASKSTLKDECNDLLFQALKLSPSMSMYNAQLQELGLELVPAMLDGDFFSGMNKTELDACCKELHTLLARQEKINVLLEEQCSVLRSIKKKYKKSH